MSSINRLFAATRHYLHPNGPYLGKLSPHSHDSSLLFRHFFRTASWYAFFQITHGLLKLTTCRFFPGYLVVLAWPAAASAIVQRYNVGSPLKEKKGVVESVKAVRRPSKQSSPSRAPIGLIPLAH